MFVQKIVDGRHFFGATLSRRRVCFHSVESKWRSFNGPLLSMAVIRLRVRYENYYRINHIYDGSEINFKIYLHFSYIMMCVNCGVPRMIRNYAFNPTFSLSSPISPEIVLPTSSKMRARGDGRHPSFSSIRAQTIDTRSDHGDRFTTAITTLV